MISNKTLISIIVPVFNVEEYLEDCLNSIINQSYNELEIILVDDGSTDKSGLICDEYANHDSRIKVIHKRNGGMSDARNIGIDCATGKFLTFIDSDDYISHDYCSYLYNLLIENNADLSICNFAYVDQSRKLIANGRKPHDRIIKGNEACVGSYFNKDLYIGSAVWGKLYRSELLNSGIRFPKGKYHEDVYFSYKIIALCNKIAIGGATHYLYRQRTGSIMSTLTFSPKYMDAISANIEMHDFISNKYPEFEPESVKSIMFAAFMVAIRMSKSKEVGIDVTNELQSVYRRYLKLYLKGDSKIINKCFAIMASINLSWVISVVKYLPFVNFRR